MPQTVDFGFGLVDITGETWVNKRAAKRTVPMEVLVLGLPRTSTASMCVALQILGYNKVYHMLSVIQNPPDAEIWNEAAAAKFKGKGKPFTRIEFDQVLGDCRAATDFPPAAFGPELIAAYPEAKIVLTMRDVDAWYKSVASTIGKVMASRMPWFMKRIDPGLVGPWLGMGVNLWAGVFGDLKNEPENMKAAFEKHYDEIRRIVPKERLLEFRPTDGWEPLCEFLGKEVPHSPYPRSNDSKEFDTQVQRLMSARLAYVCRTALAYVAPIVAIGAATYFARTRGYVSI